MANTPVDDSRPKTHRPYWWQWPTVLSLDAPAVALAWQAEFAAIARVRLRPVHVVLLAAAVWLVYAADRWIEGWSLDPERVRTHRHRFYQIRRRAVAALWLGTAAAGLAAAVAGLSRREFVAGFALVAPVLVYELSHQWLHRHSRWRAPKEVCVGALFAAGVALFPASAPGADLRALGPPVVLFALLCFANCALISVWESEVDRSHGQTSFARQFRRGGAFSRALPWILACAGGALFLAAPPAARAGDACLLASGALFGVIDRSEARLGRELARVLVDAALLTPLISLIARSAAR